jgi:hypothetical protein
MKHGLVQRRETVDRLEAKPPAMFPTIPVQAQVSDDSAQPSVKARRTSRFKATQPPEPMTSQLLAHVEKTLRRIIIIVLEKMNDLQDQDGILFQEATPGSIRVLSPELLKESGNVAAVLHEAC